MAEGDQCNEHLEEINVQLSFLFLFFLNHHPKLKLEGCYFDVSVFCHHMDNFKMELEESGTFF